LVLAGSSSLEECFTDPELESFSQRLAVRCYLGPFSREEAAQFVRAQVAACRVNPDEVFSGDAYTAIFEATDGVPRLINQLCDRALVGANTAGLGQIDRPIIQAAWADIQQLPTPWETPEQSTLTPSSRVIEFGNLSGEEAKYDPESDSVVAARLAEFDTELDLEDEAAIAEAKPQAKVVGVKGSAPQGVLGDPFTEKFEEEEVVLDSYAAWDDMFRRDAPRVANRRDPGFATMVEAAIQATETTAISQNYQATDLSFEFDLQNLLGVVDEVGATADELAQDADASWPPLRIADVPDASSAAPELALPIDHEPVLIIEDDAPAPAPPKAPVRREEYRNLFSRLRSG
jgi:hypothetical protein